MYLAGRLCKFEIQEWTSKPLYRRWWEQFVQDVPVDVLEGVWGLPALSAAPRLSLQKHMKAVFSGGLKMKISDVSLCRNM